MSIKSANSVSSKKKIQKTFEGIFEKPYYNNPATPFTPSIKSREILFLSNGIIDQELYEAIKTAAQSIGDTGFYLLLLNKFVGDDNWEVPFDDDSSYQFMCENAFPDIAIFSPKGKWGIFCYDDGHVVIGGSREFTETAIQHLSPNRKEKDLDIFLKALKDFLMSTPKHDYSDISIFLKHIYGDDIALTLIDKYSLR